MLLECSATSMPMNGIDIVKVDSLELDNSSAIFQSNGHGKRTTPDNETNHARFPLPNPTHEPPPQNGFRRVRLRTNG